MNTARFAAAVTAALVLVGLAHFHLVNQGQSSGSVSTPPVEEKIEANSVCHLEKLEEDLKEQQKYFEQQKEERQKRNRAGYGKKDMVQHTTMNFHYSKVTEVI